jgi:hypothetical protein
MPEMVAGLARLVMIEKQTQPVAPVEKSNLGQPTQHLSCRLFMPSPSPIMGEQEHPRFWRIRSPESSKVTESYCLGCSSFVGASQSVINLRLVELLHLARCKQKPNAGLPQNRIS